MKRLSFFSVLLMVAGVFLFLGGCQKDQIFESPQTSSRTILDSINNAPSEVPESHFLFKRPLTCILNENLPDSTWNPVQLMKAFGVYNQLKCDGRFEITKHGEPIWASTIYYTKEKRKYTTTPLEKDGQILTLFSLMEDEATIGVHFLAKSTMSQSEIETYWPQYDGGIKCPSWGKSFFEKVGDFFESIFGPLFDGFGTSGNSNQTSSNYYWFYTGGSNEPSGGFGNTGGSGGSGTNGGYINPMGGYWNCDSRLKNVEGCRKYFKDNFNFEINDPALEEKIEKCGCYRAVMNTGDWINKSNGEKCLDCYGGLVSSSEWAQQYDILEQFLNNLEFPCQNVDQSEIDKIKDNVYTQACIALYSPTSSFYPGKALTEVLNQLEVKGLTYIARSNKYGKGLAGATISIASMAVILDLTSNEIATLSNEEICRKIQVSECLKPAAAGTIEAGMNAEKAALLDFYKNTTLINPCNGETIDKDAIFQSMCEKGEVSMSGLDEAFGQLSEDLINCSDTNPCEDELIRSHPVAAFRIYANSTHATRITIEQFGYNGWLDCTDAFRHTLFNALNAIDVGKDLAQLFADAHECDDNGTAGTGNEVEMDLHNNNQGFNVGNSYPDVPIEVIIDRVCDRLEGGLLKISTGANPDPNLANPNAPLTNSFGCKCN